MTTFFLDYELGDDGNAGDSFAAGHPWKTFTLGATLARIAPNDIIRIAKSPAPYSIGHADWTDLSKTVTLEAAATATIENCENHANWTSNPLPGDTTLSTIGVATTAKQGSNCVKFLLDAGVQTSIMQAYYDLYTHNTTVHNLAGYQKISFWIYNSAAIVADNWNITLCTDIAGATVDKTYKIPAIPSTLRWVPLTLASEEGGNISASIKSIAVNTGTVAPTASSYIYLDNIIASTTSGLNLQSLISLNTAEQGGTEGWFGIQSIDGVTILLDSDTNTLANAGEEYSGASEHITTYARETIKTAMAAESSTVVQEVMDSGSLAVGNIQFQGGYDTGTGDQTGETFFDGLNGNGYGIQLSFKSYITLNYLNVVRYQRGVYFASGSNNTITTISNANNNTQYGVYFASSSNNTITTISNANNNTQYGVYFASSSNNTITTISNANNNTQYGVYFGSSSNNTITTISNANNNTQYGVYFTSSSNNTITTISNANNNTYGVYFTSSSNNTITTISTTNNSSGAIGTSLGGYNYIQTATLAEGTKVRPSSDYSTQTVFIQTLAGFAYIETLYGNVVTQNATAGGTGIEWKISITNVLRNSIFPLKLQLAQFAANASAEVTITCYFKKSQNADMYAALVIPGLQPGGDVANVVTPCPDNTNRNQLQVKFTPSAAGVFYVEAWAYYLANLADEYVLIDDISITQA